MELVLPNALNIATATEFRGQLVAALGDCPVACAVGVVASQVEAVDTTGVQLLLGFVEAVRVSGGQVRWIQPSEALRSGVARLGLSQRLGLV